MFSLLTRSSVIKVSHSLCLFCLPSLASLLTPLHLGVSGILLQETIPGNCKEDSGHKQYMETRPNNEIDKRRTRFFFFVSKDVK